MLAACVGICIGLSISYLYDKNGKSAVSSVVQDNKVLASFNKQKDEFIAAAKEKLWPRLSHRTNILLMGVDSNGRNTKRFENTRTDTMIIASIDPFNKKVGLISIPRDSRVKIADKDRFEKVNAAHALGGPELAVKTVERALSVPIDHYVVIDRVGLKDVFEIIGPVEVNVEKRMRYRDRAAGLNIDLKPGVQELDAKQVEQYVRFRYDQKGDIGRIARQQWFLRQAQKKLKDPAVLLKVPEMIRFASDYVQTDMSVQDMTALIGFGKEIGSESIETAMLPGEAQTINGGSYWIIDPESTALVLKRLSGVESSVERIALATGHNVDDAQDEDDLFELDSSRITYNNDTYRSSLADSYVDRPFTIQIRYPRGQEQTARDYEQSLALAGYRVRSLIRCRTSDCQHEKIELNSFRCDDSVSQYLKSRFPEFKAWALVMNPKQKTRTDFTIQISPDTQPLMPHETVNATFDFEISGFGTGEIKSTRPASSSRFYNKG